MKAIFIGCLLFAGYVHGEELGSSASDDFAEPVQELFLSELPFLQEKGELQMTVEAQRTVTDSTKLWTLSLASELGISDDFQLGLNIPYHTTAGSNGLSGLGNISIEAMHALPSLAKDLMISAGLELSLPSVTDDLGEDNLSLEPQLSFYRGFGEFGGVASLGVELAFADDDSDEDLQVEVEAALGIIHRGDLFATSLEILRSTDDGDGLWQLAPGITWSGDDKELGIAVAVGLNEEAPDWQLWSSFSVETDLL